MRDAIAVLAEMVTSLEVQESVAQGMFVVGSGVDVTAVKAHLQDLVSVPVIAPEEPQLALARGAALASANAPRYDTSTIGLAYSQDPDGTTVYPLPWPMTPPRSLATPTHPRTPPTSLRTPTTCRNAASRSC